MENYKNISGDTLIGLGYRPGKWFKEAIEYINENKLTEEAMKEYLLPYVSQPIIPLNEAGAPFAINIRAEEEVEISNVESVIASMQEIVKTPTVVGGAIMPDACPTGLSELFR